MWAAAAVLGAGAEALGGQDRGDYVLEGGRRSRIWREQLQAGAHALRPSLAPSS
jgi:hypothetical protein